MPHLRSRAPHRRQGWTIAAAALLAGALPWLGTDCSARAAEGPASVADLAARLQDSVVNVSTSQTVTTPDKDDDDAPASPPQAERQLPPGSPFEEFFNQFFQNRGGKGQAKPRKTASLGSGFVVDASGIIVTNNHVIEDSDDIEVNFTDGSKLKASVVGRDTKIDLAVLKVTPPHPLTAVRFADSDKTRVGDWVMAVGNPFGLGGTVTLGIISARNRDINSGPYDDYLQTDAAINRGNSGGPLFDMDGNVVGINTAIISPSGGSIGIGFSIPADTAAPVIDQLRQYGHARRGWLGVRIQQVTDDIAESLGMKTTSGALIAGIDERGPAKTAGIQTGDVILSFNGRTIREMRDLSRFVADTPVGRTAPVTLMRGGQQLSKTVTVGLLDETETKQASLQPPAAAQQTVKLLGLDLAGLTVDLRQKYKLGQETDGVVVTGVEDGSPAADKQVHEGDVILEIAQEAVRAPQDVTRRVEALRKDGKKSALLLLSNPAGEHRFVALGLD